MLAEIHGWFIEGFDTADLKDAGALLEKPGGDNLKRYERSSNRDR